MIGGATDTFRNTITALNQAFVRKSRTSTSHILSVNHVFLGHKAKAKNYLPLSHIQNLDM